VIPRPQVPDQGGYREGVMSEELVADDQSHYEVSLTAGQAFLAFVLLLLSLAASFAFGLMIGRGQGDEKLLAQSGAAIVDESPRATTKKAQEQIVELGQADEEFVAPEPRADIRQPARTAAARPATIQEEPMAADPEPVKRAEPAAAVAPATAVPHYAQLLSTSDQKKAEALAARLINGGFNSAYVDRANNEKGSLFRVRVNFPSEQQARAAEGKLKTYSKEVWITK
jgi:cell division protein FtsN